jgi:hypothetical protein
VESRARPLVAGKPAMYAPLNIVAPGFLETDGIEVVRGRDFSDADREGTRQVALVSQGLAAAARRRRHCGRPHDLQLRRGEVRGEMSRRRRGQRGASSHRAGLLSALEQQYSYGRVPRVQEHESRCGHLLDETGLKLLNPNVTILETLSVADGVRDAVFYQYIGFWSMAPLGWSRSSWPRSGIVRVASYEVSSRMGEIGIRTALGARPGRGDRRPDPPSLLMAAIASLPVLRADFWSRARFRRNRDSMA